MCVHVRVPRKWAEVWQVASQSLGLSLAWEPHGIRVGMMLSGLAVTGTVGPCGPQAESLVQGQVGTEWKAQSLFSLLCQRDPPGSGAHPTRAG